MMNPSPLLGVVTVNLLLVSLLHMADGQQNPFQSGARDRDRLPQQQQQQQFPSSNVNNLGSNINLGSNLGSSSSNLLDPFSRQRSGFGGDANNLIFEEP